MIAEKRGAYLTRSGNRHLLYTFARSARCISWNNVAAVDSKDKETWCLSFSQLSVHVILLNQMCSHTSVMALYTLCSLVREDIYIHVWLGYMKNEGILKWEFVHSTVGQHVKRSFIQRNYDWWTYFCPANIVSVLHQARLKFRHIYIKKKWYSDSSFAFYDTHILLQYVIQWYSVDISPNQTVTWV